MMLSRLVAGLALAVALAVSASAAVEAHAAASGENPPTATADHPAGPHEEAGHGGQVNLNPVSLEAIKADLAIWTAAVFLVLLLVLWKFAWGPIASGLDKREKGIASQIDQAQEANRQAQQSLGQYQEQLADAKDQVRSLLEQGRRDADKIGREMIEKARTEAAGEQQQAIKQIDAAAAAALKELAEKGADLAVDLAGKIVRAELKPADHAGMIDRAVADFAAQKPAGNGNQR